MSTLTLAIARKITDEALAEARRRSFKPVAVVVVDARAALKAAAVEDGTPILRPDVATAKATGAVLLGQGSRAIGQTAVDRPHFMEALHHIAGGRIAPVPGGVLIRDQAGVILGAVGISGDTSDNDEAAAKHAIAAAGLVADGG
jgi:uncharacterized protein GlcG (DUF336 family)